MIIGIDGNEANVPNRVGVSVYTYELLSFFQKKSNEALRFIIYLRKDPATDLPEETPYFSYRLVKPDFIWSQMSLPVDLFMNMKPDVFFSPAHYAPRVSPVPTVVTIHDLAYKYFPNEFLSSDLYKLNKWTEYSVKKASQVICVSNHTKKDLISFYPQVEGKTTVVLNGFREKKLDTKKLELKTSTPYILFVGTIQPRKNVSTLIEAFEKFVETRPNYELKIVGKKGWLYDETLDSIKTSSARNQIKYLGFVNDSELESLYGNAYATVLPSFYEGFGLPVLEAMSHGSPVIASNTSSLPEVGGDAVLYCNPDDSNTIVDALEKLQDPKLRKSLLMKSNKQISKFSWEKSAEETLKIIKSAI